MLLDCLRTIEMLKIILTVCLLFPLSALAQSIHVTWGYTPPMAPAVTGYRLYQEGTPVCVVMDPLAQETDCDVILTKQITVYTLTALFEDGTESPHSAPYAFDKEGRLLAPWAFSKGN